MFRKKYYLPIPDRVGHVIKNLNVKPNTKHNRKIKSTQLIKVGMIGAPPLTKEERTPRPKLPFED